MFSAAIHGASVVASRICPARCWHPEIVKEKRRTMRNRISRSGRIRWQSRGRSFSKARARARDEAVGTTERSDHFHASPQKDFVAPRGNKKVRVHSGGR